MKRILTFLLAILMLVSAFGGCKKKEGSVDTQEGDTTFSLTKELLSEYTIIIPENCDADFHLVAEQLKKKVKDVMGAELKIKNDFVVEGSNQFFATEHEILIGNVSREAAKEIYPEIREDDSGYALAGKKLLVIGRTVEAVKKSYNLLLLDIFGQIAENNILMRDGDRKIVVGNYTYDKMTLNGVEIQKYKIVYPALFSLKEREAAATLVELIKQKTGYTLISESDKAEPSQHEIQIGQTNRITDALLSQRDDSNFADGKYGIFATENGVWFSGNSARALQSAVARLLELFRIDDDVASLDLTETVNGDVKSLSVRVMTYNVLYNFSENRNPDHVLQSIETINADVFGINEATEEWISRLTSKFNSTYTCMKGKIRSNDKSGEYCPIFYKTDQFELVESGTKWLSDTPDKISKYKESHVYRIFSYAILRDKETGVEFMFISAHLENNEEGYDSKSARKKQSAVLKSFTDGYSYLPIVIAGDMNCTSLNDISPLTSGTRFVNAPSIATEKKESGTWVGKNFASISDGVLDYILVTSDRVSVTKYEAVDNKIDGKYPSDHIPVRIDAVIYR